MSDELRDRIAKAIWSNEQEKPNLAWTDPHPDCYDMAQTVIDDLGLTTEERFVYATDLARDDEPVTEAMAQRVVGRWEKQ